MLLQRQQPRADHGLCNKCWRDGNGDGNTDGRDIPGFVEALLNWDGTYTTPYCAYDMTGDDAYVDASDISLFVDMVLFTP